MAWLLAGAALAAFALSGSRDGLRIAAFAVLAGGIALALRVYPPPTALGWTLGGAAFGFTAAHLARSRSPLLLRMAALLLGTACLLFASVGPADGLF